MAAAWRHGEADAMDIHPGFRRVAVIGATALSTLASAAGPDGPFQPTQVSASPDRNAGLQAFANIERVLLHGRCLNCHVPDAPLQGDAKAPHYPPVQRGVDGRGVAPLQCATCHGTQNSPLVHAPPGLDTDGQPGWHMPPASMKMSWLGLNGPALCKVFREPKTNGGRSLAMLEEHMVMDHLVAWGWQPGPGRTLPPLDKPSFDEQVRTWIRNGAPCDTREPLRTSVGPTRAAADEALVKHLREIARSGVMTKTAREGNGSQP
ncbi:hypothetical protein [Cupriavidus necator]|uniref:hypothetical protein n=1 Tax=Cupriavidus necator TaxID=106590 RepID=UPI001F48B08F|nr:hypothetical protein [Cupriavidus necator]